MEKLQVNRKYSLYYVYALPTIGIYFLLGPIGVLQGIYAKYFGLSLTSIASVLLISRLFDAISDPIIGYCSDKYHANRGSRKPFVACGGVFFVISSWFLFVPSLPVSEVYFLFWFLAFYLAYTLFDIPHLAWAGDLTSTPEENNIIFGRRALGLYLGTLLFHLVPFLPFFDSNAFTPQTLRWAVIFSGLLVLPLIYMVLKVVPDGISKDHANLYQARGLRKTKSCTKKPVIIGNTALLTFLVSFFFSGVGIGMWFAMLFIFTESYLGLGEYFAIISLAGLTSGILSLNLWRYLASRFGKQICWSAGMAMVATGFLSTGMIQPGESSLMPFLVVVMVTNFGYSTILVLAPSLLSDIIYYSEWKYGQDCAGTYFSLYTLTLKTNVALGGALSLAIAGWFGFDPSKTDHSINSVFGLNLSIAWLPVCVVCFSIFIILLIPINARQHQIVFRRVSSNEK